MKFYNQTTEYTTAACSLLMVVNHYSHNFPLNRENEFLIWRSTVNLPTRAASIYGLAVFAKEHDIPVKIVVEETEYDYPDYRFKGYTKNEIDEAKFMSKQHAKNARKLGITLEEREFGIQEVRDLLKSGKILLLRVNAGVFRDTGSTSKYLVFHKVKDNNTFTVLDPAKGPIEISDEQLEEALETLHTKKKRDRRMIIFG